MPAPGCSFPLCGYVRFWTFTNILFVEIPSKSKLYRWTCKLWHSDGCKLRHWILVSWRWNVSFSTGNGSVGSLLITLYPRLPTGPNDNRCHLQVNNGVLLNKICC